MITSLFGTSIIAYPSLEGVAALCVHSSIGHYILVGIVHVTTVTSMVAIRNCV